MMAIEAVAMDDTLDERLVAELLSRPDARRFAAQVLVDLLAEMAQHGWETRLLANLVRRRLSARHAKVITNLDTLEGVQPVIEVLALIGQLPPLTPLPASTKIDKADAKILAKVRGLLAKAESTTFPEEAEALSAKAQELMARHAIDHALAAAAAAPEQPGGRRLAVEDPYADAKAMLISSVSRANHCRAVHVFELAHVTLLGFEPDLVAVELLFTSLLVQANRAMLAAGRADPRSRQPGFRRSFLSAYALRIGERLEACTSAQVADADADEGGRLLPALAARDDAVEEAVEAMFGDRLVHRQARISDPRGWVAGHAAADLANLAVGPEVRAAG
ncbi:MAG: DUF2786 domain-containing protein [Acidimicrobiales bacterium]